MDEMPDYSKYTLDNLYDVYNHVDREKYPDRFKAVEREIEKQKPTALSQNIAGSGFYQETEKTTRTSNKATWYFAVAYALSGIFFSFIRIFLLGRYERKFDPLFNLVMDVGGWLLLIVPLSSLSFAVGKAFRWDKTSISSKTGIYSGMILAACFWILSMTPVEFWESWLSNVLNWTLILAAPALAVVLSGLPKNEL